jgi:predicted NUDIX family NTP pyrophosphohydrolase
VLAACIMPKRSAGILLYRQVAGDIEVLLVHPGGPYWANKDAGAWGIPKGGYAEGEDALAAALREFEEETGLRPQGAPSALGSFRQSSSKWIDVWAVEGDFDPAGLTSNTFEMEWPPRSGRVQAFPEVDRAAWFDPDMASRKMHKGQIPVLVVLLDRLGRRDLLPDEPVQSEASSAAKAKPKPKAG